MTTAEPDAALMARFCDEILPSMLTEACDVDTALAAAIGADVLSRARSFAALPDPVRDVLMTPFIEEVFEHDPPDTDLELKAAVTVVVRYSLLEEAHANGPVEAGGLQAITTAASAPLSHLLAVGRRGRVQPDGPNLFAHLPGEYPRTFACLTALADTFDHGGRGTYRAPNAPTPSLPPTDELIDAPAAVSDDRISVLSAIDPRFDRRLTEMLEAAAYEKIHAPQRRRLDAARHVRETSQQQPRRLLARRDRPEWRPSEGLRAGRQADHPDPRRVNDPKLDGM